MTTYSAVQVVEDGAGDKYDCGRHGSCPIIRPLLNTETGVVCADCLRGVALTDTAVRRRFRCDPSGKVVEIHTGAHNVPPAAEGGGGLRPPTILKIRRRV